MNAQYTTQLTYRKLDESGDMIFGATSNGSLTGLDAMRQVLQTRLRAIRDEWWEGDRTALPWFPEILGGRATEERRQAFDLMVVDRIMDTVGVIGVSEVRSAITARHFHFSCKVQTVYGTTTAEVNM